jgi:hypothetical protein
MNQMNPGPHNGTVNQGTANQGTVNQGSGQAPSAETAQASGQPDRAKAVLGPFTVRDLTVFASTVLLFVASLLPVFGRYNLWNLSNLFFLGLGIVLPLIVTALFVARRLQPENAVRIGSLSVDQFASVVASFTLALYFLSVAGAFTAYLLLGLFGALGLLVSTVLAPHIPVLRDDFKDRPGAAAHPVARNAVAPVRKPAAPKPTGAAPKPAQPTGPSGVPAAAGPIVGAPASGGPFAGGPTPAASGAPATSAVPAAASPVPGPAATKTPTESKPAEGKPAADKPEANPADAKPAESRTEAPEGGTPEGTAEAAPAPVQQGIAATMAHPVVDRAQQSGAQQSGTQQARAAEPIGATVDPSSRPEESSEPVYEAFWFAVPQPRTAVDEHTGAPAFTIEPGGWVLALEDRGEEFLVQNTDGRLGVLRDLSHVERG